MDLCSIFTDNSEVVEVDFSGPLMCFPQSVALDSTNNRALVVDGIFNNPVLISVDLISGDRVVMSK